MKKKNLMTAVLLVLAVLLAACTPISGDANPTPSSSLGGLEDNTVFGDGSQPTGSSAVSAPATQATQLTQPTSAPKDPAKMDYKTFQSLTGAEQRAFQDSFESIEAFFAWYNAAKEAYEKENPSIEVGGNGAVTLPANP